MPPIDVNDLARQFQQYQIEYEKRHAELEQRVTKLEECVRSLATREDIQNFKVELVQAISTILPTQTDVDWLKRAFWAGVGAVSALTVAFVVHMFGKI
jgi:hypothetical protein